MAVTEAQILAFVNNALSLSPALATGDLDIAIQQVLDDLSEEHFLETEDTSQALTSSSVYLSEPSDMLENGLISIVLNDGSVDLAALKPIRRGYAEYRRLQAGSNNSLSGNPTHYARRLRRFYLWTSPGQSYTTVITYFKQHPATPQTIEFADTYRNAIYYGATMYEALSRPMVKRAERYAVLYAAAKAKRRAVYPDKVHIVR